MMPGMTIMAPKDENELRTPALHCSQIKKTCRAFRYPRGSGLGVACEEELKLLPLW